LQHCELEKIKSDAIRDTHLNSLGLLVKRYANNEINENLENICGNIYHFISPDLK
jgi:very-short-patch-repair endonuclease